MQSPHRTSLSRSHSLVASPKRKGWCFTSTALLDTTRTEADFLEHVQAMVASNPETIRWHIVCDQLNTHQSETLVRWVAELSGVEADLGVNGQSGILASMVSQAAFLSDPTHKVVFHYTRHPQFLDEPDRNVALDPGTQGAQTRLIHQR